MKKLLLCCLLGACSGGGGRDATVEVMEPATTDFFVFDLESSIDEEPRATTFNELVDSIAYLPLETHKDALLPVSYKFAKIGGDIFIGGGSIPGLAPIYRFDSLGRFVRQMTYNGRGPNEIFLAMEWFANPNLGQINVVSTGRRMVVFSTEGDGRFTIEYDESQGFHRVPLNDSTFVSAKVLSSASRSNAYLFFTDRTGEVVHSVERADELADYDHETSEYDWSWPYENYWLAADYRGDALFHDIFNDTLYRVRSRREISPHLVFERGSLSPRPEDTHRLEEKDKQIYFASAIESGDHVFLSYWYKGLMWSDVWSKRDGGLDMRAAITGDVGDIFVPFALPDGSVVELQIAYADKECVYGILGALDACKFLSDVHEDDNPVIVVARLRR
ncbi:MAG: 6-bladed beta-propeller [Alistipes sp.]|jgi:hypothetical protein|nr:6-bladed beta-propeller [Alistipes sp.]